MLKMMTASVAVALLVGAASTALAARTHTQNDPAEHQANMLVRDSVAVGASNMKCSIPGLYHDEAYCFGSEATGRTRISGAIPTTSRY
jgi:undecaprenyl pyrophosphate phosphatase UppP